MSSVSPSTSNLSVAPRRDRRREDAAPVMKWAGGKTRLLKELLPRLPEDLGRYFEPFFGGGAMFFRLQPHVAVIADANAELINVYTCIRDDVDRLVIDLQRHRYERDYYYWMRGRDTAELSPLERASRTLYLNRTCFNGLYRVNRRGQFNVPFGRYKDPVICQESRLRAVSALLTGADVRNADYREVVADAREGDFVYFDPPYQPLTRTANFTSYTASSFGEDDQATLARTFAELDERGVRCMLSNSDTPLVQELYRAFRVETILAPRAISRNGRGRAPVREVVVRNY